MTAATVFERQITAKRSPAVVATQTRHATRRGEMLSGRGRADLPRLRRARSQAVAISTCKPLTRVVVCMTERVTISAGIGARGLVSLLFVTDSARSQLASRVRFARRRMARVAVVMCGKVRGNRQSGAAIDRRVVTTGATSLRATCSSVVLCVIEADVETLVEAGWKILQRWIVAADVCVTDDAHRYRRRRELSAMTVGAGFVTREAWRCRVVSSLVTGVAGEGAVSLARVKEF